MSGVQQTPLTQYEAIGQLGCIEHSKSTDLWAGGLSYYIPPAGDVKLLHDCPILAPAWPSELLTQRDALIMARKHHHSTHRDKPMSHTQ